MSFDSKAKTWDADPMKVARAEAVAVAIRAGVPLSTQMSGFEYGCGTGLLSFALRDDLDQLTLADSSPGMLDVLREKIATSGIANMHALQLDLTVDAPPAQRYDLIYSLMTLHHIPDTARTLRELHTLLAPGGHLCIADLEQEDGSFHDFDKSVHWGFAREALQQLAEQAGFRAVRFSSVFNIEKSKKDGPRNYPVFLLIAEKD